MDSGPGTQTLQPARLTIVAGSLPKDYIWDTWPTPSDVPCPAGLRCWVGVTCFFLNGVDLNKIDIPTVPKGVKVLMNDGSSVFVAPSSVKPRQNKKILQFDYTSAPPIFEHASAVQKEAFRIPEGQFGSSSNARPIRSPTHAIDEAFQDQTQQRGMPASMGPSRHQDGHVVEPYGKKPLRESPHPGVQAPCTGADGLHGGNHAGGERCDAACDFAAFDDQSSWSDSQGQGQLDALPGEGEDVPARRGVGKTDRQRPRSFSRMSSMRACEKGADGELPGSDHRRGSDRLRHHPRSSRSTRRKSTAVCPGSAERSRGMLSQLGRMLLALIATAFCTADPSSQHLGEPDFGNFFTEEEFSKGFSNAAPGQFRMGERGHGHGPGWLEGGPPHRSPIKPGLRKRLKHSARRALQTSQTARELVADRVNHATWPKRSFGFDLVEIFGGTSMISIRAVQGWNLRVLQPVDIRFGTNLRQRSQRRWLMRQLNKWNPRLAIVEMPCTPWSILQRNVNYRDDPEGLHELREADRPFIKLTKEVFESQQKRGGHALVENPASADSWSEPEFLALRQKYFETTSCMCRFGMVGKHGLPMLKRVRWMGTHPTFVDYLNLQCQHQHEHELVEGQNTPLSACYPPDLADTIIQAYLDVVQQEDFGVHYDWQVMETRHVHYVDVSRQESDWRPLLAQAEEVLARKVQSSCFLDITSDLYQKIIPLVPWQILNVQIAHLPKAKRLRPGLENCHRASVLLQTDDVLVIETEHLPTAQAPRERFVAPVKVAIFVLGHAPGEPQEPVPARLPPQSPPLRDGDVVEDPMAEAAEEGMAHEGLVRQDFASGECWFSGSPLKAEQKRWAPALVRMHRNLGHPRPPDFVRALLQHGKVDPEAIALARRLKCATCERTRRPLPPRPSSLKSVGSFNDKLCLDLVFLHDTNEEKHTYLHILDPAGGYNVFIWIPSRAPEDVLEHFNKSWSSCAGFPRSIWADRDELSKELLQNAYSCLASPLTWCLLKHIIKQAKSRPSTEPSATPPTRSLTTSSWRVTLTCSSSVHLWEQP